VLIAAKYSWRKIPDKYKEKAWQELLKRGIENEPDNLHYLLVNATESWQEKAKKLKKN
jgi:rRNA pseudouridine-1189 N-methylase Emg1 (Nep1/Mra1 family)